MRIAGVQLGKVNRNNRTFVGHFADMYKKIILSEGRRDSQRRRI